MTAHDIPTAGIELPAFVRDGVNLASARLGAVVLSATDDFFAPKERLLQDIAPVFIPDKYDDHGKWMDGWETRRRRGPGHDHCVVRLGLAGVIRGVEIDTRHFTGNYPPAASVDACRCGGSPDESTRWVEIMPATALGPNRQHFVAVSNDAPFSHLRLNIYPDGGIARLGVWGEPLCPLPLDDRHSVFELSALASGGRIVAFNDAHYGDPSAILAPGRGRDMGDGWETRRRREPGNDWIIVQLGAPGVIEWIEVDTAHFKGNYPDRCSVQGALLKSAPREAIVTQAMFWPELLASQPLQADREHRFDASLIIGPGPVSHVKLNIYPDGGISRFRVFGRLV